MDLVGLSNSFHSTESVWNGQSKNFTTRSEDIYALCANLFESNADSVDKSPQDERMKG